MWLLMVYESPDEVEIIWLHLLFRFRRVLVVVVVVVNASDVHVYIAIILPRTHFLFRATLFFCQLYLRMTVNTKPALIYGKNRFFIDFSSANSA